MTEEPSILMQCPACHGRVVLCAPKHPGPPERVKCAGQGDAGGGRPCGWEEAFVREGVGV